MQARQPWTPADVDRIIATVQDLQRLGILSVQTLASDPLPWVHVQPDQLADLLQENCLEPGFRRNGEYWQVQVEHRGVVWVCLLRPIELQLIGYHDPGTGAPRPGRVA
ncbi:MAG: hypothetical protein ACOY93_08655 [Bacillota bacterium]